MLVLSIVVAGRHGWVIFWLIGLLCCNTRPFVVPDAHNPHLIMGCDVAVGPKSGLNLCSLKTQTLLPTSAVLDETQFGLVRQLWKWNSHCRGTARKCSQQDIVAVSDRATLWRTDCWWCGQLLTAHTSAFWCGWRCYWYVVCEWDYFCKPPFSKISAYKWTRTHPNQFCPRLHATFHPLSHSSFLSNSHIKDKQEAASLI